MSGLRKMSCVIFRIFSDQVKVEVLQRTGTFHSTSPSTAILRSGPTSSATNHVFLQLFRKPNEKVCATLRRLQLNLVKKKRKTGKGISKGKGKGKGQAKCKGTGKKVELLPLYSVHLSDGVEVDGETMEEQTNEEFWQTGMRMKMLEETYSVLVNPPTVAEISTFMDGELPIFQGLPIVPSVSLTFATGCRYEWYTWPGGALLADSRVYVPKVEDVGLSLQLVVTAFNGTGSEGLPEKVVFGSKVEDMPRLPMLDLRKAFIEGKREGELRVASYNLLANQYASQEEAQERFFSHTDKKWLEAGRRAQVLLHELCNMRANLMLLQEVDEKTFNTLLEPSLDAFGYGSFFTAKGNKTKAMQEGCAVVYSLDVFERPGDADRVSAPLHQLLEKSDPELDKLYEAHQGLENMVRTKIATAAQFLRLRFKERQQDGGERSVVVANTHLFYHPYADHIRAIQAYAIAKELARLRGNDPVILGGDLNSDPESGVVQLLTKRTLDESFTDCWKYLRTFAWELDSNLLDTPVECSPPRLELPSSLPDLEICSGLPNFTHYNCGYQAVLDYVFMSRPGDNCDWGFQGVRTAPVPPLQGIVEKFTSIPNEEYPSDHILVAADVRAVTR